MSQTSTREERRSALDDFAASTRQEMTTTPSIAYQPPADLPHGAMALAVHRDEAAVLAKIKALAAAAGTDWFYRYPVKNRKENRTDYIEGPSIKLANDIARIYGNCEVDCRAQDFGDTWLFQARFIDLETGFSLARPFQQRKSGSKMGGADDDRRLDIAFQIGASKAIRNVVVNALQTFADFAFEEARESMVEKIGRELDKYRARTIERIAANKLEIGRVEAVVGRAAKDWLAPDVARVIALMTAIKDGMASTDETFPPLAAEKAAESRSSALDTFAAEKDEPAVDAVSVAVDAQPEETPHDGVVAMEDVVKVFVDADGEVLDPVAVWRDAVQRLMTMATDPNVDVQGRLENLDQRKPDYVEILPADKVKPLFETLKKVAEGDLPVAAANRYLKGL